MFNKRVSVQIILLANKHSPAVQRQNLRFLYEICELEYIFFYYEICKNLWLTFLDIYKSFIC